MNSNTIVALVLVIMLAAGVYFLYFREGFRPVEGVNQAAVVAESDNVHIEGAVAIVAGDAVGPAVLRLADLAEM